MVASIKNVEADTLADMKQDVPLFTKKLRRVLAGKSRVELSQYITDEAAKGGDDLAKLEATPATVRGWISQGTIPKNGQIHFIAEFAGCSPDYLTDDRIPLESDPKQGRKPQPMNIGQLIKELRERYIDEACKLDDYTREVLGTPWNDVVRRLLALEPDAELEPDLDRAVELATLRDSIESQTVGPFVADFKGNSVHTSLRPINLLAKFENAKSIKLFTMAFQIVKIRQALVSISDDEYSQRALEIVGAEAGAPEKVKRMLAEMRPQLEEFAKTGFHLIDGFFGVANAGGIEQYYAELLNRIHADLSPKLKAGEVPNSPKKERQMMIERGYQLITQDSARQTAFELNAIKNWQEHASTERVKTAEDAIEDRDKERYSLLIQGFDEFAKKKVNKSKLKLR